MSLATQTAEKCFIEARDLVNQRTEADKWDLYNGLANLAQAVRHIEGELEEIKREIRNLHR